MKNKLLLLIACAIFTGQVCASILSDLGKVGQDIEKGAESAYSKIKSGIAGHVAKTEETKITKEAREEIAQLRAAEQQHEKDLLEHFNKVKPLSAQEINIKNEKLLQLRKALNKELENLGSNVHKELSKIDLAAQAVK